MAEYSVLIGESSEEFRRALEDELEGFCTPGSCSTGPEVLEKLRTHTPEVLVLDLMLPGMDGISLLNAVKASGRRPAIAATTTYISPYLLRVCRELGVSCILEKPCTPACAAGQIRSLLQSRRIPEEGDLRSRTSGLLLQLGFRAKLRGYAYLQEAVCRIARDPDRSMVKEVYAGVGAGYGVSARQVERSIRGAVQVAWENRDPQAWALCLGEGRGIRPTSAALIQTLGTLVRGEQPEELPKAAGEKENP